MSAFLQARSGGPLHLRQSREKSGSLLPKTRCGFWITASWWPAVDGDLCRRCVPLWPASSRGRGPAR